MFYGKALSIALPIMLQQLIQNLVSLIDNFKVAGLGDVSMSGVNIAGQILFVFMIFLNTICMSGGIYLTQFFGAMPQHGHNVVMMPLLLLLAAFTDFGPLMLYFCVKLLDVVRVIVFHLWLRRERWLRNLAAESFNSV
jgi:Na+-driven multidrug efflux pump